MRLIDADELKEIIEGGFDIDFSETPELKKELLNMVDYQETIDAEPVIHCKDCKFFKLSRNGFNGECFLHVDAFNAFYASDYCSYAERRDDE